MKPDNQAMLVTFFEAENNRDWATYSVFLSNDVVWELRSGGQTKTISGKEQYVEYMRSVYERYDNTFVCEEMYVSGNCNRIVAILKNDIGERSCDIFDFDNGLIVREYEFTLE
ncbi:MAG TPA: nuclear transport factor 2 family protein [Candidatus Atribacteria bacterium]|jgi:ketosteroid isomerase-like protein|nr:nuclear transport factor 2 family protein [Candidatus Atribacteria bacterium]